MRANEGNDEEKNTLLDKVGPWTEIKLEIIQKYGAAYSTILSKQSYIEYVYIDAFAGYGKHKSKTTQDIIKGSPRLALEVEPPFKHYYFIDIDNLKVLSLRELELIRPDCVDVLTGDANKILVEKILPTIQLDQYRRALCLLDPYGLHLDWSVINLAGQLGTTEIFLNFPIMDMNRNVLTRDPSNIDPQQAQRMTAFWGDESWRAAAYSKVPDFFDDIEEKETNTAVVEAFCKRLKNVAGFNHVAPPLPMKNSNNAVLYYLIFASPKKTANKIVKDIFDKYR